MNNIIINGLDIKAVSAEGIEIKYFEIIKIKDLYYGVRNIESTDREFLELKVIK